MTGIMATHAYGKERVGALMMRRARIELRALERAHDAPEPSSPLC